MKLNFFKNRVVTFVGVATVITLGLTGCSRGPSGGATSASIEIFLNMGADSPQYAAMTEIIDSYETETGVTVEVTSEGTNYEDQMKVKMASNDLPDIITTHGWSLLRYSQFLEPLTDQAWADDVNPALDSAMRDDAGQIYAFPGETDVAGILYNADVLSEAGIDEASLTTWEEFDAAAEKLAAGGTTPIYSSGKAQGPAGLMADFLAADSFTSDEMTAMQQGEFIASAYSLVLDRIDGWQEKGWFNKDYSSASLDDIARALANGDTGFVVGQTASLSQALTYNPDANLGFMPLPGTLSTDPYLVGGEGVNSFGVAKNSDQKQASLDFLSFLAQPENAAKLAQSTGSAPGLSSVEVDFGPLDSSFKSYVTGGTTTVLPYFDRVYLPSGSWNTMVATADSVITGQSSPADAVKQMESQFYTLYGQQ